jgi:hypothetical protein
MQNMPRGDSPIHTAELCVESLHPAGAQPRLERVIGQLRRLVSAGSLDGFDVTVWGDRIGVSTAAAATATGESIRVTAEACQEWAARNGRTFRPCFDVRSSSDAITGEEYTVIDLPTMVLVEYVDGALAHAVPSSDGTATETVSDRLTALEAGGTELEPRDGPDGPGGGAGGDRRRDRTAAVEPRLVGQEPP